MTTTVKPRLHYFDMMKGVAIFMVVMGHVLTMCVREIDRAPLFKFIGQIHMPLFFFISGWFTYKITEKGGFKVPNLNSRAVQLLLPMVVVSTIWIYYFPHSGLQSPLDSTFAGLWADTWKNGYWFTLTLFFIIAIYAAICPLLSAVRGVIGAIGITAAVWILLFALKFYIFPAEYSVWGNAICLEQITAFFPAFMMGVLGRRYRDGFMAAVHNSWCQTMAMAVLGVSLYVCCWPWEFGLETETVTIVGVALHVSLAIIALNVFEAWSDKAFAPDRVPQRAARIWEYIGTQSLAVYLLHYFFLFPMGAMRPWLADVNLSLVPLIVFAAFWASAIVAAVLGLIKIIEPSRVLTLLLTGKRTKA